MSSSEDNRRLEEKTLSCAAAIVNFSGRFKRSDSASVVARQLVRAGTSIGANYREANRAESRDDFIHNTAIALKEASETVYWLDLCERTDLGDKVAARSATGGRGAIGHLLDHKPSRQGTLTRSLTAGLIVPFAVPPRTF